MVEKIKILVTGAGGTVGCETVKNLLYYVPQAQIIAFDVPNSRSKKRLRKFERSVKIVFGDLRNKQTLQDVTKNVDFVIHLAAIIPPLADKMPDLAYDVNVLGTKNLLESLEQTSPAAKIIYASSVAVYGDRLDNPWIKVTDKLKPNDDDFYAHTKIQAENLVKNSGLEWTIFRVSAVFGVKNHKISELMFHMPVSTPLEFITPADAGRAFAKAVVNWQQLSGKIFNLGGGEKCRITYRDFLKENFKIYGLGEPKFPPVAFATTNFHCGYYADGDELEQILNFRHDSVESYFEQLRKKINPFQKFITQLFSPVIQRILLSKSQPLKALLKGHKQGIKRFFGENIPTNRLTR